MSDLEEAEMWILGRNDKWINCKWKGIKGETR